MNKLQTNYNGGMPLELDDIRWEQDAVRDALFGLISAFGVTKPTSFKLSGCVVTKNGNDYHCTAGYICYEGEVLKVDACDLTITNPAGTIAGFGVDVTYDPTGNETFEDLTVHDTYEIRKGMLVAISNIQPAIDMIADAPYLTDLILTIANETESWHNVGATDEPAFESGWTNKGGTDDVVSFRKDNNGVVHIKGVVTSSGQNGLIFTLPSGYRPSATRSFVTGYIGQVKSVQITSDGLVWLNTTNSTDVSLEISFAL